MIEISKADIKKQPIELQRLKSSELEKFKSTINYQDIDWSLSFLEKVNLLWHKSKKYTKIILIVLDLLTKIQGLKMNNDKKTTVTGVVKTIVMVIVAGASLIWGAEIPADIQSTLIAVGAGIWAIVEFIQGKATNKKDDEEKE